MTIYVLYHQNSFQNLCDFESLHSSTLQVFAKPFTSENITLFCPKISNMTVQVQSDLLERFNYVAIVNATYNEKALDLLEEYCSTLIRDSVIGSFKIIV